MAAVSCIVCNNTLEKRPDSMLFPFPEADSELYQIYLALCGLDETVFSTESQLHICSLHFASDCFRILPGGKGSTLKEGSVPSLNLSRIEIEALNEDFEMLDEYAPIHRSAMEVEEPASLSSEPMVVVPKQEPMDPEEIEFNETEVKTEAPDVDEGLPDPFDNIESEQTPEDGKYCLLCGDTEEKNPDCRLYLFPRRIPKIYRKWMLAAGLDEEEYKSHEIYSCQKHFPENGFFADGKFVQSWATPKLNIDPTRKLTRPNRSGNQPEFLYIDPPATAGPSTSTHTGPQIVIKTNPQNRKNAEALNIDPDSYAKTFAKVVSELVPRTINFNGEVRPVTGTIVFQSNLF
ncbi:uncharacterized protein LOC129746772 [Uranotaenia lowii]|uniref:uncharacterized protein LOC129746772 n=1 Tax=Uranotaenia lowii TaxID=190385 RepID=UPI00247A2D8B|nr:uncharacterized protein LOC129746772 [Uranotaenia lowii]